jgi:hypothetical protein
MVGAEGIEPTASSVSGKRSPTELRAYPLSLLSPSILIIRLKSVNTDPETHSRSLVSPEAQGCPLRTRSPFSKPFIMEEDANNPD